MIGYYVTAEDARQRWIEFDPTDIERIKTEAHHIGIYFLSHRPDDEDFKGKPLKQQGHLVFDLDYKNEDDTPDLPLAIKEANQLLDELVKMGVPEGCIELYASGSKGFHFILDGKMFGANRLTENLPLFHKYMVSVISGRAGLTGTDLSLYNSGKGKLLRNANMQRANRHYKVPIKIAELRGMTPELYSSITSLPRVRDWVISKPSDVDSLFELFREAVLAFQAPKTVQPGVSTEQMQALGGNDPVCIQQIVMGENIRETDGKFNSAKMTVARYIASSGTLNAEYIIETFANSWESSKHSTASERARELRSAIRCFEGKDFVCSLAVQSLEIKPCKGCALNTQTKAQQEVISFSNQMEGSVFEGNGVYEKESGKSSVVICNFTMKPTAIYYHETRTDLVEQITLQVNVIGDDKTYSVTLPPVKFASKGEFKKSVLGLGAANFYGGDNDPSFIYALITAPEKLEGVPQMTQSSKVGIIHHKVPSRGIDERVWLQDDWAVNYKGIQGTLTFKPNTAKEGEEKHKFTINLKKATGRVSAHAVKQFEALMGSRDEGTTASFLGFMAACWVKPTLQEGKLSSTTFPVLQVYGGSGSGKSSLVRYWSAIAGADVISGGAISLGMTTPAALREEAIMTTTVPRIIDEANPNKATKLKWIGMVDVIKSCSTMQSISIMKKKPDGTLVNTQIVGSSPLITMGVARIEEAEVEQRSEQIGLFLSDTKIPEYYNNFEKVQEDTDFLAEVAGAFMHETLVVDLAMIEAWQIANFRITKPLAKVARLGVIAAEILTGLQYAEHVFKLRAEENESVIAKIQALRNAYLNKLKSRPTELVDGTDEKEIFLSRFSEMVATYRDTHSEFILKPGIHFVKTIAHLHIRPNAVFILYTKYLRETGVKSEYANSGALKVALSEHKSFTGSGVFEDVAQPMDWVTLDLSLLSSSGLDVTRFDRK